MITSNSESARQATEPQAQSRSRAVGALGMLLIIVLLAVLLAKAIAGLATSVEMFSYPFQFDESEGMIAAETMLLDKGVNIYDKPGPDLFVAAPYPPLFYLLDWPLQRLAGPEPTFKAGRAISLLSTAAAGVAIFAITLALTGHRLASALGAVAWWSLSLVTFWGSLVKPDMLALALGLWGLAWVVWRPPAQVWYALPFFVGAFFTKQTAIAAVVAALAWLLITRFRTGIGFGIAYGASVLVPSLLLNSLTAGGYYYHMFTIHDLPWFPERYTQYVGNLLGTYWELFVPGIVAIVVLAAQWAMRRGWRSDSHGERRDIFLLFYLVMSFVAATGTGTLGGNHNHLLELSAAACLGLGVGIARVSRIPRWKPRLAFVALGLVMLAFTPTLFSTPPWLKEEFSLLTQNKREGLMNIFQYVTNNSGQAYSDNVGLMLTTGKKLWTTDPFTQTHATFYGRWDESKLVAAIKNKEFSQIVLRIDILDPNAGAGDVSPGILQAVRDNYKLDQRNVENIYIPK